MYLPVLLGHGWVFPFSSKKTMGKGKIHGSLTRASQKIKEQVLTICHTSLKNLEPNVKIRKE
jgi:ribosomal protein S30